MTPFIALSLTLFSFNYAHVYPNLKFVDKQFNNSYIKVDYIKEILGDKEIKFKDPIVQGGVASWGVCEVVLDDGTIAVYYFGCDDLIDRLNNAMRNSK